MFIKQIEVWNYMSRKAVPPEIRAMTGNKSSHPPPNPKGLKIKRAIPAGAPSWMTQRQKEIWREGVASAPRNLLREVDTAIFKNWVFALYSQERAAQLFESQGAQMIVYTANGSPRQNPLLGIIREEGRIIAKLASEMGFTPTARTKVKPDGIDSDSPEEENAFTQFSPGSNRTN
jgi:P27 family predicted phage terminase small subunit